MGKMLHRFVLDTNKTKLEETATPGIVRVISLDSTSNNNGDSPLLLKPEKPMLLLATANALAGS